MTPVAEPPRILIAEPDRFSPEALAILRVAGEVELRTVPTGELAPALREYDAVWIRLGHRVTTETLATAGPDLRCRVLACPVTGLDHIDLDACAERGIRVVSLKGETTFLRRVRATAELALGLTLALLRRIPQAAASVRDGEWDRDRFPGHELFEKTAGIVGVGRLGSIMAECLGALGMRVLGYDPRPDFPDHVAERVGSLDALLAASDLVSIHVSYDATTHHLIGPAELAAMKPGAVLVNTARGGVLDEGALLDALRAGRLAGAALDVLYGEPDIAGHPLVAYAREHDNLLIVPHLGGNTAESWVKTEVFLAGRVVAALKSAPVTGETNPQPKS